MTLSRSQQPYSPATRPHNWLATALFSLSMTSTWSTNFALIVLDSDGSDPVLADYQIDANLQAIGDGNYSATTPAPLYFREKYGEQTNGGVTYASYDKAPSSLAMYLLAGQPYLTDRDTLYILGKSNIYLQDQDSYQWFSAYGSDVPEGSGWIPAVRDADICFDATTTSGAYNIDAFLTIEEGARLAFKTHRISGQTTYTSIININGGLEGQGALRQEGDGGEMIFNMASPYFEGTLEIEKKASATVAMSVGSLVKIGTGAPEYVMNFPGSSTSLAPGLAFQGDLPASGADFYWDVPVKAAGASAAYLCVDKEGSGRILASSDSTFTAGLNLREGTITMTKGSTYGQSSIASSPIGSGPVKIYLGATLGFQLSDAVSDSLHHAIELSGTIANQGTRDARLASNSIISLNSVDDVLPELRISSSGNLYVAATITGSDPLLLTIDSGATGKFIFEGNSGASTASTNTYSGGTSINGKVQAGGLSVASSSGGGYSVTQGPLGTGLVTVLSEGELEILDCDLYNALKLDGGTLLNSSTATERGIIGSVELAGNSTIQTSASGSGRSLYFSSPVTGTGGLEKRGARDLHFNALNTYTGSTKVIEGGLKLMLSGSIASSSRVVLLGGYLDLQGISSTSSTIKNLQGTSSVSEIRMGSKGLIAQNEEDCYFSGKFVGTGSLTFEGMGSTHLAGDNSAFSGSLTANQNMTFSNYLQVTTFHSSDPALTMTLKIDPLSLPANALLKLTTVSANNQIAGDIAFIPSNPVDPATSFKLLELPSGYGANDYASVTADLISRLRSNPFYKIMEALFDDNRILECKLSPKSYDEIMVTPELQSLPEAYRAVIATLAQQVNSSNPMLQAKSRSMVELDSLDDLLSFVRGGVPSKSLRQGRSHMQRKGPANNAIYNLRTTANTDSLMSAQGYKRGSHSDFSSLRQDFQKIQTRLSIGGEPATEIRMQDFQDVDVKGISFSSETSYSHESIDSTSSEEPGTTQSSWATSLSGVYSVNKLSAIGALITTTKSNEKLKANSLSQTENKADRYNTAGVMGLYQSEGQPWFVSGVLTYGQHNNDENRTWNQYVSSTSTVDCQATAKYKGYELYVSMEAGWKFDVNAQAIIQPYAGFASSHVSNQAFQETSTNVSDGAVNNYGLIVPAQSVTTQSYSAGLEVQYVTKMSDSEYQLMARLGGTTEKQSGQTSTYTYSYQYAPSVPVTTTQDNQRLNTFDLTLGVQTQIRPNLAVNLMYTGNYSSSSSANTALVSLEYQFA